MKTRVPGRLLAWGALLVALGASVGANVASARPDLGPQLSAGVAPVLTALAVGLIERVTLESAQRWQRGAIWVALGLIASFAFVTSYQHQYALLNRWGNPAVASVVLPLAVDGLIVMASVCLSVIADQRRARNKPAPAVEVVAPQLAPQLDTTPAVEAVVEAAASPRLPAAPRPRRSAPKKAATKKGRRSRLEQQAEIRSLLSQDPEITTQGLAERLGVTPSYVRTLRANGSTTPANAQ